MLKIESAGSGLNRVCFHFTDCAKSFRGKVLRPFRSALFGISDFSTLSAHDCRGTDCPRKRSGRIVFFIIPNNFASARSWRVEGPIKEGFTVDTRVADGSALLLGEDALSVGRGVVYGGEPDAAVIAFSASSRSCKSMSPDSNQSSPVSAEVV